MTEIYKDYFLFIFRKEMYSCNGKANFMQPITVVLHKIFVKTMIFFC